MPITFSIVPYKTFDDKNNDRNVKVLTFQLLMIFKSCLSLFFLCQETWHWAICTQDDWVFTPLEKEFFLSPRRICVQLQPSQSAARPPWPRRLLSISQTVFWCTINGWTILRIKYRRGLSTYILSFPSLLVIFNIFVPRKLEIQYSYCSNYWH